MCVYLITQHNLLYDHFPSPYQNLQTNLEYRVEIKIPLSSLEATTHPQRMKLVCVWGEFDHQQGVSNNLNNNVMWETVFLKYKRVYYASSWSLKLYKDVQKRKEEYIHTFPN